jgi:hypothetical protein
MHTLRLLDQGLQLYILIADPDHGFRLAMRPPWHLTIPLMARLASSRLPWHLTIPH